MHILMHAHAHATCACAEPRSNKPVVSKSPYPPKSRHCVVQNVSSRYPESLRSSRSTGPLTAPRKACPIRIRPAIAQLVNQTVARGAGQARRDAPAERKCSQKERRPCSLATRSRISTCSSSTVCCFRIGALRQPRPTCWRLRPGPFWRRDGVCCSQGDGRNQERVDE